MATVECAKQRVAVDEYVDHRAFHFDDYRLKRVRQVAALVTGDGRIHAIDFLLESCKPELGIERKPVVVVRIGVPEKHTDIVTGTAHRRGIDGKSVVRPTQARVEDCERSEMIGLDEILTTRVVRVH